MYLLIQFLKVTSYVRTDGSRVMDNRKDPLDLKIVLPSRTVVRSIFHELYIAVDKHDLSTDSSFLAKLKLLLGPKQPSLSQIFIEGRYVSNTDEINDFHLHSHSMNPFFGPSLLGVAVSCHP